MPKYDRVEKKKISKRLKQSCFLVFFLTMNDSMCVLDLEM